MEEDDEPEGPEVFSLPGEVRVTDGPPGGPPSIVVSPSRPPRSSRPSFRAPDRYTDPEVVDDDAITRAIDTSRSFDRLSISSVPVLSSFPPPPQVTPGRGGAAPRVFYRHPIVVEAVITTPNGTRLKLRTANVSKRGLFVAADVAQLPLEPGMTCKVLLVGPGHAVDFEAEVIRFSDGRSPGETREGVAFQIVYLSHEQEAQLDRLIQSDATGPALLGRLSAPLAPRRFLIAGAGIVGLLAVGFLGAWWVTATRRTPISVTVVIRGEVDDAVASYADGEILPEQQLTLRSTLAASKMVRVLVKRGDRVDAGQALVEDAEEGALRDALGAAQRRRASAEAQMRQLQHPREGDLAQSPDIVDNVRGNLAEARALVDARAADLKRGQIVAPFAGVVAELGVQTGDLVAPSNAIGELVDDSSMHAHVAFGEAEAARIRTGMQARVSVTGVPDPVVGTVNHVGTVVHANGKGRWVSVEIGLPSGVVLRAGTTATAQVVLGQKSVLLVPVRALEGGGPTRRALVVNADDRVEEREVTVGSTLADLVEVTSGLEEGGRVVSDPRACGVRADARFVPR